MHIYRSPGTLQLSEGSSLAYRAPVIVFTSQGAAHAFTAAYQKHGTVPRHNKALYIAGAQTFYPTLTVVLFLHLSTYTNPTSRTNLDYRPVVYHNYSARKLTYTFVESLHKATAKGARTHTYKHLTNYLLTRRFMSV